MIKEIGIGSGLGIIGGLIILGLNVYPLIFVGALIFLIFRMMDVKGGFKQFGSIKGGSNSKKGSICFEDVGGQESAKRELQEARLHSCSRQ